MKKKIVNTRLYSVEFLISIENPASKEHMLNIADDAERVARDLIKGVGTVNYAWGFATRERDVRIEFDMTPSHWPEDIDLDVLMGLAITSVEEAIKEIERSK